MNPSHLLWEAVRTNDTETANLILSNVTRVDINKMESGLAPVHISIINNEVEILGLLLHAGATLPPCETTAVSAFMNTGKLNDFGTFISPLTLAAAIGKRETVSLLLEYGKITQLDPTAVAISVACEEGHAEIVKMLVDHGGSPYLKQAEESWRSPLLHAAAKKGNVEVVKFLLDIKINVSVTDNLWNTPLHMASTSGCMETVQVLLSAGACPCVVNQGWISPFHLACQQGYLEILILLMSHKCSTCCDKRAKNDLIYEAVEKSHTDIVSFLINSGEDVNKYNHYGRTPLVEAVSCNNKEIVDILLAAGADPSIPQPPHDCPIIAAAQYSSVDIVEALLREGASVNTLDIMGLTPLCHLMNRVHSDEVAVLTKLLIDYGTDVNHRDMRQDFPLSRAAMHGHYDCMELLIQHGAHINSVGCWNRSALHLAANKGCAELLLHHGADIDHPDINDVTPLMWASAQANVETAVTLIEHGADVNTVTADGASCLYYAVCNDQPTLVREIIMSGLTHINRPVLVHSDRDPHNSWNMLELALVLQASHSVCSLLRLSGAKLKANFVADTADYDTDHVVTSLRMNAPRHSFKCALWNTDRFRTNSESFLDKHYIRQYKNILSLEAICFLTIRKYLNYDRNSLRQCPLPEYFINNLTLDIF